MAKMRCFLIISTILLLLQCQPTVSQALQQTFLTADVGQSLIPKNLRNTTSTTVPGPHIVYPPRTTTPNPLASTTTKKPGFFSNLRNIFSRGSTEATTTTTTTTPKPITSRPTHNPIASVLPNNVRHHHQGTLRNGAQASLPTNNRPPQTTPPAVSFIATTTTSTTTTRPTSNQHNQDFPPLTPPRSRRPSASSVDSHQETSTSVWASRTTASTPPSRVATTARVPVNPLPTSPSLISLSALDTRNQDHRGGSTLRPPLATDAEMEEFTEALFKKSTPNLLPFVMVNLQGRTRSSLTSDDAPQPLLRVNETIFDEVPTIAKMRALFNNYELDSLVNEYVSPIERQEENDFIDEMLKTPVMKLAMKFLQEKGVVTADPKTHFDLLKTIWFNLYSRGQGKIGSSAFEHVFMNEIKNHTVTGLHNWIWYYYNEGNMDKMHDIDYKGYMKSVLLGDKGQLLKYRFSFDRIAKPVNAMFIGTPPELDMALYTVCFEVNKSECRVSLDGNKFVIRTYPFKYRGKRLIGSAFPEI